MRDEMLRRIGAVDIGGTKIAVAAVSEDGRVLTRRTSLTVPERGFADAIARIAEMLREVSAECGALNGIGVGCPGPLDPLTGTILEVGTLPAWAGGELARELSSRFGVGVAVENDADAAALAELHWGAAGGARSFIYVAVSTGIGGGIALEGKLYRGVAGAHPELGHQVIDANGPECYCGARGCWESLASGTAMSAFMRSVSPDAESISAAVICERAAAGDEFAMRTVRREGYYLGLGLANLVTLFAPESIALGGGVMASGALFLDEARSVVKRMCTQVPAEKVAIGYASLGEDVGLLGAARCWLQRFDQQT